MNAQDRLFIESLKNDLSEIPNGSFTDFEYLKWLQENEYSFENTVHKMRQYWRILNSYDFSQVPKGTELMNEYWPYGFIDVPGKFSDGAEHFIYIETLGTMDGDGVVKSVQPGLIFLHRIHSAEILTKSVRNRERETGKRVDLIFIYDMADNQLNVKTFNMLTGPFLLLCRTMIKYYASVTSKIIVVRVPHLSSVLYNAFKPMLPEKTRNKLVVLGSNWKSEILKHLDPNVLPAHYGGNLVDENDDPKCPNKIVYTKKVPCHLYWSPSSDAPKLEDLTVLTVHARSFQFVSVYVDLADSTLEWYYLTDADWGFSVFFTEDETESDYENNMAMVYPQIDRIAGPAQVTANDRIVCKKRGFYKIWFNNSFSWFSKVHIYYKISVLK